MKQLLTTLLLILIATTSFAYDVEIDGIYYNISSSKGFAEVTFKDADNPFDNDYSGVVVIPSTISYEGIIYSVTSIGNYAFEYCYSLTSVNIPNSVTSIGDGAFFGCSGLTSVTIPNSVTSIGDLAFSGCEGLTSVTIPNSVTIIGYEVFSGCTELATIKVDVNNPKYDSRNNCNAIIETVSNKLISGCKNTIIPNSVTSIGDLAFSGCTGLTSIIIPNSVTNIGNYAFYCCTSLTSIIIPNSVTSIGKDAFWGCSLTSATIGKGVTTIPEYCFGYCNNLTNIVIKGNLEFISERAFSNCKNLKTFICYALKVPGSSDYSFSYTNITSATLYVPDESIDLYRSDPLFGRFGTIKGLSSLPKKAYAVYECHNDALWLDIYGLTNTGYGKLTFHYDENAANYEKVYLIDDGAETPSWQNTATNAELPSVSCVEFDKSFAFARPTTTQRWFSGMKNLKTIEGIENLNTSDVTIMSYMFLNCQSLETLDLSHFDTRKVDKMGYMMQGCTNLKSVDLTGFETSACTSFYQMFKNCSSLETLDLSPLTITEGVESRYMLNGCTGLKSLTIPETAANLNSSSFVTVGTSDAPCELHAPEGFDFGTDTNGAFQWKSGWFYLAVPAALTASVASLSPGSTASLTIGMTNGAATSYNGYEMVLTLPEGMTLAKSGSRFDCTIGDRYSSDDFTVSINDLGGGAYRIIGFSLSNTTVTGSDGPLFMLKVTCSEGVATGSYTGTLEDISLSTTAGTGEEPEDVTFPITVSEYRLGDVDLNGKVNVVDVMLVVNRVLGETAANYHDEYADMDGNGKVNVVDIMTIIDVILTSPRTAPMPLAALMSYNSHLILSPMTLSPATSTAKGSTSGGTILSLDGTERFTACQMDVRLDGSTTLRGIKLLGTNASTHSVKYFHIGDDLWRVVVYSTKGAALESNAPLLQLITNGSQHASIENIEMCNTAFDTVTLDCMEGTATGIAGTATDAKQVPTYTIQGIRTDQPQRGVNIRNGVKLIVK